MIFLGARTNRFPEAAQQGSLMLNQSSHTIFIFALHKSSVCSNMEVENAILELSEKRHKKHLEIFSGVLKGIDYSQLQANQS